MDGPRNPHDILAVLGEKELQGYLVNEIQEVYRLQGVGINDKHIEVIVRQMMRWVKVEEVGDTEFLIEEQVDKFRFQEENERVLARSVVARRRAGRCCSASRRRRSRPTRSSPAASFQETTRVLTEASISGKVDHLRGLKENVTMGRLIPGGHGLRVVQAPGDPARRAAATAAALTRRARSSAGDGRPDGRGLHVQGRRGITSNFELHTSNSNTARKRARSGHRRAPLFFVGPTDL
jgi:hypothetical protein